MELVALIQFIQIYGTGSIDRSVWAYNALDYEVGKPPIDVEGNLEQFRIIAEVGFDLTYSLYPDPGGLFPWGASDFGQVLLWRTIGAPDDWDVVVSSDYCKEFHLFEGSSMVDFMIKLVEYEHSSIIEAFGDSKLANNFIPRNGAN